MEDYNEEQNPLIISIEMSLRAGMKKHEEFVKRHKNKNKGCIDKFYKAYCLENDFEENKRVEEYWKSINPNVNNSWEFKHLTALKTRGRDAVVSILKEEAVTDIFIESNLMERAQFLDLAKLSKSIYYGYLAEYLRSITFISSNSDAMISEISDFLSDTHEWKYFNLLCGKIEIKFVEHFDKSTERIIKSI